MSSGTFSCEPRYGDIGDVRRPHLARPCYLHATEQVGVDLVTRCRQTGPGAPVDGFETHHAQQSADTLPVDLVALTLQPDGHLACPVEWRRQVLTVNQLHDSEVLLRDSFWLVVQAGTADIQQAALTYHRERRVPTVYHGTPSLHAQRPDVNARIKSTHP